MNIAEKQQLITDYLLGLYEDDLIQIAAEYLGEDAADINHDSALAWVEGLSEKEVADISNEMGV